MLLLVAGFGVVVTIGVIVKYMMMILLLFLLPLMPIYRLGGDMWVFDDANVTLINVITGTEDEHRARNVRY